MTMQATAPQSSIADRFVAEEAVNQITHAIGLLLAIGGAAALAWVAAKSDDIWRVRAAAIYGTTLVALYAASTLSHSFLSRPRLRHFFRTVDQVCIFFLIAGTYTPFGLIYLRDGWTWNLTLAIWALALLGAFVKIFYSYLRTLNLSTYVLLGWLPLTTVGEACARIPGPALLLVLGGGILYTAGTWFLAQDGKIPFVHGIWHLMVVAASACHFWAIFAYTM